MRTGRREDTRFLTGTGRYVGDIRLPGEAYAAVLRSPVANARLGGFDFGAALELPGVLGIFTADDIGADLGHMPCQVKLPGVSHFDAPRPALARGQVRFVGDSVALVVAESSEIARDACELIEVDYHELTPVVGIDAALAPGAPEIWPGCEGNKCFDWSVGDKDAANAAFDDAAHVTHLTLGQNRIVMNSIETRLAVGEWDEASETYTLTATTQGPDLIRRLLAEPVLGVAPDKLRVLTPDVGGGFGLKHYLYNEYALVLWAARRLGRPVSWTSTRLDAFQTDTHGRIQVADAALALDENGRFLALRVSTVADLGAYLSTMAPLVPTVAMMVALANLYTTPVIHFRSRGVFTNTTPVDAYRGAGRPEAVYIVERLIDAAAMETGIDPIELRRRNLIPEAAMPYTTPSGHVYDSGRFAENMQRVLDVAGHAKFEERRRASEARGLLRGFGIANYVENTGGATQESAEIRVGGDGRVRLAVGTQSTGQGHETTFPQVLAGYLGLAEDSIDFVQGDSDDLPFGGGTGGSRSLAMAGSAIRMAGDETVARATEIATHLFECSADDIQYEKGILRISGTDREIGLFELARRAEAGDGVPTGIAGPLMGHAHYECEAPTYPNGCHACEVEIDPDTGVVKVVAYCAIDDFGRIINSQVVSGQVHGGVAQGIGQAILEEAIYDKSGQLLTASYMDYPLPRASDIPALVNDFNEVPCTTNALGVKGAGESGAIAAPPAVMNAIVNALRPLRIRHLDMPATPAKVWAAIRAARAGGSGQAAG